MKTSIALLTGLALCAGCQSALQTKSTKTLKMLTTRFGPEKTYRALRTNDLDPSKTITVQVKGQVIHPGVFELPQGITLLEAILEAGGFTEFSAKSDIHVTNAHGNKFRYGLMSNERRRLVWCGTTDTSVVLEEGMIVDVLFRPLALF